MYIYILMTKLIEISTKSENADWNTSLRCFAISAFPNLYALSVWTAQTAVFCCRGPLAVPCAGYFPES